MDIGVVQGRTCSTRFLVGAAAQRDDACAGDHVVRPSAGVDIQFRRTVCPGVAGTAGVAFGRGHNDAVGDGADIQIKQTAVEDGVVQGGSAPVSKNLRLIGCPVRVGGGG